MKSLTLVGSGASAVHFAETALERGWRVTLLDVGRARPEHVGPELSFAGLKRSHPRASEYFLGPRFEGVLFPGAAGEYYGFPPHREYVFAGHAGQPWRAEGLEPLFSFARGGLAEAWTGAVFPFRDEELVDWPFGHDRLAPHYDTVARRIGVMGVEDDLAAFVPLHAHLEQPLDLDPHSRRLAERYGQVRGRLHGELGVYLGRSRAAVLGSARPGRGACEKKGRCLWGCPNDSIYSPLHSLRELEAHPEFQYRSGVLVQSFEVEDGGRVTAVHLRRADGTRERLPVERLVLAAGTLSSGRIVLESLARAGEPAPRLGGLMDNRQVLVPFVNLSMLGSPVEYESYQYHQLALGITPPPGRSGREYVHGLVTTLKSALIHPIAQSVPFDLRSALGLVREVHAALGLVNLNFHDTRRPGNALELDFSGGGRERGGESRLVIRYEPEPGEGARIADALGRVKRALWRLSCVVPPGMVHVRPMGASVHYAGTLPMSRTEEPRTTTESGRLRGFANLWLADGSTFPFLPAKNLTFTLMANASRLACEDF
ncbi:MAG: hypothetical protein IPK67_02965 [Planctomycetes bacterium]|nr:hypothetical protein [Planctomycetota bacterium]